VKTTIISSTICLVIGAGSYYLYHKNQSNKLESGINVNILEGKPGTIEHEKIKNYPKHIEIITRSRDKGKIKTTIKKVDFCPKIYKNSLSFVLGGGIVDMKPVLSYGIEYRYQIISRAHNLTGVDLDFINGNRYYGTKVKIGAGFNF
jgi:hypothetical protein